MCVRTLLTLNLAANPYYAECAKMPPPQPAMAQGLPRQPTNVPSCYGTRRRKAPSFLPGGDVQMTSANFLG